MKKILFAALPLVIFMASCAKQPEACFQKDKNRDIKENEAIQFNATCSVDAEEFNWSFGDGNSASGSVVTHSYTNEGTYEVKLRITGSGVTDETSETVTVIK